WSSDVCSPDLFIQRHLKLAEAKHSESVDESVTSESTAELPSNPRVGSRTGYRRGVTAVLIALSIAIVTLAVYFRPQSPLAPDGRARSLAVLPFKAIGDDGNNDKLGLGMADSI